jgi:hypothetical protein
MGLLKKTRDGMSLLGISRGAEQIVHLRTVIAAPRLPMRIR